MEQRPVEQRPVEQRPVELRLVELLRPPRRLALRQVLLLAFHHRLKGLMRGRPLQVQRS
jgi:hypothetical protein